MESTHAAEANVVRLVSTSRPVTSISLSLAREVMHLLEACTIRELDVSDQGIGP